MKRRGSPPFPDNASDTASPADSPVITLDADDFVHQPHDSFFKSVFGDVRNAAEVLRTALPPQVSAHIDWDSLQVVKASFVDDALKQRHGDLMYLARLTQGGEAFLWVLFEHQSSVEPWMGWRMLRMMVDTLDAWRVQHPEATRLPPVLPVVLYQGATPWTAPVIVRGAVRAVGGGAAGPGRVSAVVPLRAGRPAGHAGRDLDGARGGRGDAREPGNDEVRALRGDP
jgi:hypothetical protein